MSLLKKIIVSLLLALILLLPFANFFEAYAATSTSPTGNSSSGSSSPATGTWYNQSFQDWFGKVYDTSNPSEIFGERYTAAQVQWVFYGLLAFLVNSATGPENTKIVQCFLSNATKIDICVAALKATIGATGNTQPLAVKPEDKNLWQLVFATDRPISGISYVKERFDNFSIVPVAHAQAVGFGFTALQPIQIIWRAVRDISYGLFVIAAVALAFMIMFRVKINPQTVISVQSAIPKVVIALILVTFSYAMAGFLIDLMYVVIGLISLSFGSLGGLVAGTPSQVFNFLTQGQVGQASGANANFGIITAGALYIVAFIIGFILLLLYNIGVAGVAIGVGVGATGAFLLGPLASFLPLIAILLLVLILIVIIWNFIKTMWSLLKAFANVILLTIFAPLQIAAGILIPSLGFGSWVKGYVSNLAVFVVTGILLFFSFVFLGEGWEIGFSQFNLLHSSTWLQIVFGVGNASFFNPSISSAAWPPLLGSGNSASGIGLLLMGVSLVLFTMIPKANNIIQSVLSGKPFAFGAAIGETMRPITFAGEQIMRNRGPEVTTQIQNRLGQLLDTLRGQGGRRN